MRRLPFLALTLALAASPAAAQTLTPEQVLEMRKAGISDATIQQMLKNEDQALKDKQKDRIPDSTVQQSYANEHIGTWETNDGRRVFSTGKGDYPNHAFDPTIPGNQQYQFGIYPYVGGPMPGPPGPPR